MAITHQKICEAGYINLVFANPNRKLELYDGEVRVKPGMSFEHGEVVMWLSQQLLLQLDLRQFKVRMNEGRVRRSPGNVYIPDLIVFPAAYAEFLSGRPGKLAIIPDPLPLVVEVWSAFTGNYDINAKLPVYQQRGDREIWFIHPYEKTLTAWRQQQDGTYEETVYQGAESIRPIAMPDVVIDLAALFI